MENRMNWVDRPLWVRVGLFGVPSRDAALRWMKGSLIASIMLMVAIVVGSVWQLGAGWPGMGLGLALAVVFGVITLAPPLWYWLAIQWTDEHDGWAMHSWKS